MPNSHLAAITDQELRTIQEAMIEKMKNDPRYIPAEPTPEDMKLFLPALMYQWAIVGSIDMLVKALVRRCYHAERRLAEITAQSNAS